MYDPTVGKWITEDPIGFLAGDANLYRYVCNRATDAKDPHGTGTITENDAGAAIILAYILRILPPGPMTTAAKLAAQVKFRMVIFGTPEVRSIMNREMNEWIDSLKSKEPGDYDDEMEKPVVFQGSSALDYVLATSHLSWKRTGTIKIVRYRKTISAEIKWHFEDEMDANSFRELSNKGGFSWDEDQAFVEQAI